MRKHILLIFFLISVTACDKQDNQRNWIPPQGFKADVSKGQKLFTQHCSRCHGRAGKGTNNGPPLIHKIYEPSHHADMSFYMAAKNGVTAHHWKFGNMPPIPAINGEDMGHIVAYVRKEQQKAGIF